MTPPTSEPHKPHVAADASHDAHDDHSHGHGSRFIQHHYDDGAHQFESGKLGIWLFLAQEVLFFSALFVAYILYRHHHPEIFAYAHHYLDVKFGAINTAVLIFSSLTAAWAVRAAQLNQRPLLIGCLSVTILCALTFLGIKYLEYMHKIHEHLLFGNRFDPCVTSGGNELITKLNECPGSKGSVVWDFGKKTPTSGCYASDVDQDPKEPGVQLSCKVAEATMEKVPGSDKLVEKSRRDIPACEDEGTEGDEVRFEIHPKKFPCWVSSAEPEVCKQGVGVLVLYGDMEERGEEIEIKPDCAKAPKAIDPGDVFADRPDLITTGKTTVNPRFHELTNHEIGEQIAAGPPPEHTNMFFSIYFAMTGLHGIHVLFGVGVFVWLLVRAIRGDFTAEYFGPVDYAALYWHIVDLIWIFLFPLLYLIH